MQRSGTCFGFTIKSDLRFEFLRAGEGTTLEVAERTGESVDSDDGPLFDWAPTDDQPRTRLYAAGAGYRYWVDGGGSFGVEPAGRRVLVPGPPADELRREERLWGLPAVLCFVARGDVPLHAAAVEVDNRAVIVAAPRTFGKTTLAAGFLRAGHRVLTEDIACIRLEPEPSVIPGPAMLRVRRDVAESLDLQHRVRELSRNNGRVHLAIADRERGTCEPVPLGGIVLLREEEGRPRLVPVGAADALPDLWTLGFRLPGSDAVSASFSAYVDLARSVRIWNLFRPLAIEALDATVEAVVNSV
jgi:hypothetical protein